MRCFYSNIKNYVSSINNLDYSSESLENLLKKYYNSKEEYKVEILTQITDIANKATQANLENDQNKNVPGYQKNNYDISATKNLEKSTTPTLFIHGEADDFVPFYMLEKNYNAAINLVENQTKQMLVVPGAFHGMSAAVDEELYWNTVWNFVGKFIIQ